MQVIIGTSYKFTAKERDEETGYDYFGARYYDSDLSLWLSVDPMADQRSWVSPYSYCQDNPVVKIDPTGSLDTDFGVKENGEIVQIGKTNNDPDRLFAINNDGTKKNIAPIIIDDKNLLPALASVDPSFKEEQYPDVNAKRIGVYDPKTKSWTWTEKRTMIQGYYGTTYSKKDAKSVFTFAATNSDVEWSLKGNKNNNWIVGTLRQNAQAPGFSKIAGFYFENIIFNAHSHSGNNPFVDFQPSINDISSAKSLRKINPSSQSWLFMPKNTSTKWLKY